VVERLSRLRFMNVDRTQLPVRDRIRPRGVPNALQDHAILDSPDLETAEQVTSQLLGGCRLSVAEPDRGTFVCRLHAISFLDVSMAYLDFAAPTELHVPRSADCFTVHMTSAGQATVEVEGARHTLNPFSALVISPGTSYVLHLEKSSPQNIVRIERAALERQLSRMLGRRLDAPVRFIPVGDLTTDEAARWHGALQILSAEVMNPGSLIRQGVGAGALEELMISSLLYVQESTYSERLRNKPGPSGNRAVRRSIEYIERHLAEPISLDDIAHYAKMSPRSIQAGFRADLDTTPIAFIRDRRLDAVRRTLLAALPEDGITVTDAATRWGFNHLGSFSVLYRERFGESPSQTLRGVRSA